MDNDTKHVLTILGLVACFGAGYFVCKGENKDALKIGEKFSVFTRIENKLDGKTDMNFTDENTAIAKAVNSYYECADRYFNYKYEDAVTEESDTEDDNTKEYEYINKYQIIDDTAYINCSSFYLYSIQGFIHFFRDNPEADGFIIDLRENRGGYTDNSTNVLGYFIEPRNIVKYYYNDGTTEDVKITNNSKSTDEKVVILVNEHTASAAEIFTAAMMQFYDGEVTVIGTQTRGKGSFQCFERLSRNEEVKYTAGYYTVGNWQCYDGVGITPDIELSMEYDPDIICTDDDIQLQAALDLFK